MILRSPVHHERRIGRRRAVVDHITWEPQLPKRLFRRASWEQATIVEISVSGARVLARANEAITRRSRISIGFGSDRGLVEVRRVEAAPDKSMAFYGVQFLWLDDNMQRLFDDAAAVEAPADLDWRWDLAR